ncbi:tRNA-splicing endonuclease subunit Sen2 [Megalops cyprinoides]|uniref:tRNA-splicing endonuclease subunit Sen2 n=1 Tax=Megalops cyprinoides TaxID=118141 RepID=UPI0018640D6E|nr:tRNA-splicing endonuclease subunit Sen2 [Megalops cyprinoides]
MAEAVFQAPKRRARVYESYEAPFPVPSGTEDKLQEHRVYRAEIVNHHVIVRDPDHIQALYGKGYFGKGILSRSRPEHSISNKWRAVKDRYLPVVSLSKYEQWVNMARDALLAQGLDEEDASQMLEKYTHPLELDVIGRTTVEEGDGLDVAMHSPDSREATGSSPFISVGQGSPEPSGCALLEGERHPEEDIDSDCCGGKRHRRQGDPQYDPLAERYPHEPEQVDQKALSSIKCPRHDDWVVHCGCQVNDSLLRVVAETDTDKQGPTLTAGYEYVLVEEQEEQKGVDASNRTEQLLCRINPIRIIEYLQLSLEEAFFLVYALGCLSVYYDEEPLNIVDLWNEFRSMQDKFETTYVAYHYFRSKGWVPKVGIKYGTDLLLYRKGPPFYHASYSVVVEKVDDSFKGAELRPFSWRSLAALSRITGNVSKELMICYVIRPSDMTDEEWSSPECIKRIKAQEIIVSRWVSSRERTDQEEI